MFNLKFEVKRDKKPQNKSAVETAVCVKVWGWVTDYNEMAVWREKKLGTRDLKRMVLPLLAYTSSWWWAQHPLKLTFGDPPLPPFKEEKTPWAANTNLSKSILTTKIPKASGKAVNKCPALGYSTPGAGFSRSAHVTLWGSQNLSFQNQAERAAIFSRVPVPARFAAKYFLAQRKDVWNLLDVYSAPPVLLLYADWHTQLYRKSDKITVKLATLPVGVFQNKVHDYITV